MGGWMGGGGSAGESHGTCNLQLDGNKRLDAVAAQTRRLGRAGWRGGSGWWMVEGSSEMQMQNGARLTKGMARRR